jgi:hypothetical protein
MDMDLKISKMDIFLSGCMGICLLAYLAGHFVDKPFPEAMDAMKYFGIGLGLSQMGKG